MNYKISNLPTRTTKPRQYGMTMVMDKGLSLRQAEDLINVAGHLTDIVKLGWATSYLTPNLSEKIQLYQKANIPVYFGGTLFEIFIKRNQLKEYIDILHQFKLEHVEVSDGSLTIKHEEKCEYIKTLAKEFTVLSEVGSKDDTIIIPPYKWIMLMNAELEAGAWKVIGEARESGNVGLFRSSGEVRSGLVQEIITKVPPQKIIWEAPQKSQQAWFVKLSKGGSANINLGNIAPHEVISLETIRLGLRSDTFSYFDNQSNA